MVTRKGALVGPLESTIAAIAAVKKNRQRVESRASDAALASARIDNGQNNNQTRSSSLYNIHDKAHVDDQDGPHISGGGVYDDSDNDSLVDGRWGLSSILSVGDSPPLVAELDIRSSITGNPVQDQSQALQALEEFAGTSVAGLRSRQKRAIDCDDDSLDVRVHSQNHPNQHLVKWSKIDPSRKHHKHQD
jgi:hypothetical protein